MADTLIGKFTKQGTANAAISLTDTLSSGEVLTILSLSINNSHDTYDSDFDLWVDASTDGYIYLNQPVPAKGTFLHNSKIVLKAGEILKLTSSSTSSTIEWNNYMSALKQTSVTTNSGSEYLTNMITHLTSGAQVDITPDPTSTSDVKTVLSVTMCNTHASNDASISLGINDGGSTVFLIRHQSLPAGATWEHSDKIVLGANGKLNFSASGGAVIDIIVSFLRQVP